MSTSNDAPFKPNAPVTEMFWDAIKFTPEGSNSERFMLACSSLWIQPGDLVVELGANHGQHARIFGECCGADGRLVLVEADPVLAHNLQQGAGRSRVPMVVWNAAASDSSEREGITFYRHSERDQEGSIYERESGNVYEAVVVPAMTLDDLVDPVRMPSFVKIDVEGAEFDVLRGATRFLETSSSLVACELHRLFPDDDQQRYHYVNYDADLFVGFLEDRRWGLYTLDGRRVSARSWEAKSFQMNYQCWLARDGSSAERFINQAVPLLAMTFAWAATPSPPYPFHLMDFPVLEAQSGSPHAWFRGLFSDATT